MLSVINDPTRHCVILFPGDDSINLTTLPAEDLKTALFGDKKLTVFLLDGTWTTAKQILRESKILSVLPKVSFEVHTLSQYGFRKQPKPYCLSTVEAVHELVENLTVKGLCARPTENAHHQMLRCFQALVESQMAFELVKS
jgi:DTW domain-containing protein YfiP